MLRAWGLGWGVPNSERYYPYHPDEVVLLHATSQVSPLWLDFTPTFYNYGSLLMVLVRFVFDLIAPMAGWGSVPRFNEPFSGWVEDFARLLLVGRWITVLLGVGTVILTFWLARRLFSLRAAWIAAALTAVAPILALLGHYLTVDVPGAFFTTLSLGCAAAALDTARAGSTRATLGWLVGVGAAAGAAAGVKYNGGIVLLCAAVPLWRLWKDGKGRQALGGALAAGAAALAAFLISTPGVLLETDQFLADCTYELGRNVEGQGLIFMETAPAWIYHFQVTLPVALEWPLYFLTLAGLGWSLWRRQPEDVLLWLFIGITFVALAGAERKFIRYLTPLIPPLLVLAGRAVDEGLKTRGRALWTAAAGLAGLAAAASTVAHVGVLAGMDSRDQAAAYLRSHASPDQTVALATDPWTYTPPVHPTAGAVKRGAPYGGPPVWEQAYATPESPPVPYDLGVFRLLAPRAYSGTLPLPALRQYRPQWIVMSDYEYEDPERLADRNPEHPLLLLQKEMAPDYALAAEFRPRPSLFGFTWWSKSIPPHDWRYYMPSIRIYRRDGGS